MTTTELSIPASNNNEQFEIITLGSGGFLPYIKFFSKGDGKGRIMPGHYGLPGRDEDITDLGKEIDVLPLARRLKAVDLRQKGKPVFYFDATSEGFKEVQERCDNPRRDSDGNKINEGMYGVAFLVVERSTGALYELFFATPTARPEAKKLYPYLPRNVDGEYQAPSPVTLGARYVEKFSYNIPTVSPCTSPMTNLPPESTILAEVNKFLNEGGTVASDSDDER